MGGERIFLKNIDPKLDFVPSVLYLCSQITNKASMVQKHFNSYKEGLDLDFVRQYCLEHGEVKTFKRGELLEKAGEVSQWIAYIESGYFKYMANEMGGG